MSAIGALLLLAVAGGVKAACPQKCGNVYTPVCGSDGITYPSDCLLRLVSCEEQAIDDQKEKVTKVSAGVCGSSPLASEPVDKCDADCDHEENPICASNGKTYQNSCYFKVAKCRDSDLEEVDGPCEIEPPKTSRYVACQTPADCIVTFGGAVDEWVCRGNLAECIRSGCRFDKDWNLFGCSTSCLARNPKGKGLCLPAGVASTAAMSVTVETSGEISTAAASGATTNGATMAPESGKLATASAMPTAGATQADVPVTASSTMDRPSLPAAGMPMVTHSSVSATSRLPDVDVVPQSSEATEDGSSIESVGATEDGSSIESAGATEDGSSIESVGAAADVASMLADTMKLLESVDGSGATSTQSADDVVESEGAVAQTQA